MDIQKAPRLQPDPIAAALRRRRKVRTILFATIGILALLSLLDHLGLFGYHGNDPARFDRQTALVTQILDGQTLRLRRLPTGPETTVRLLGVRIPDAATDHLASDALTRQALNKPVLIVLDPLPVRDRAGRLPAYLYLTDADCINSQLIRDGLARADREQVHTQRMPFLKAESEAHRKSLGLWRGAP